jgi:4-amino-4-deoxy-L-arabinose transferase-like glycosyltransferase
MIIVWGTRFCGRVDQVPGFFHVATRFFHVYYVPLIPLSSYLIYDGTESEAGFRGVSIPMSFKSVLAGWGRALLIVGALVAAVFGGFNLFFSDHRMADYVVGLGAIGLAALMAGVYWLSRKVFQAGQSRALALAALAGFPPHLIQAHFQVVAPAPETFAPQREKGPFDEDFKRFGSDL